MKSKIISFSIISLLLISCYSGDDDFITKRTIELEVENLIEIEEQPNYTTNDYIYFNVVFSRYLPERGFADLLDIYKTSQATKFGIGINFYKKDVYGNWVYTNFNDYFFLDKGEVNVNPYGNTGFAVLNTYNNQYEFRAGIQLLEPGEYRLEIERFVLSYRDNYYSNKNVMVNLFHDYDSINTNDYVFFVN